MKIQRCHIQNFINKVSYKPPVFKPTTEVKEK